MFCVHSAIFTLPAAGRNNAVTEGYEYAALTWLPCLKGAGLHERSEGKTEGYEYAGQFVFYNILFYFNTSYPPFNSPHVAVSLRKPRQGSCMSHGKEGKDKTESNL